MSITRTTSCLWCKFQYGSLPDGDVEVLEHYCDPESDDGVIVGTSPALLLELESE